MSSLSVQKRVVFALTSDGVPATPIIPLLPLPSTPPPIVNTSHQRTASVTSVIAQDQRPVDRQPPSSSHLRPPLVTPAVNPSLLITPVNMASELDSIFGLSPRESATSIPVGMLRLRSSLLWEIVVVPSICPYVTSWDILQTLHRALRCRLTPMETKTVYGPLIHSSVGTRTSYDKQRRRSRSHAAGESLAPRRIDTLCGRTIAHFTGPLVWDSGWTLSMQFLPS